MNTKPPFQRKGLIGETDPSPITSVNAQSRSPVALICEHAGRTVPCVLDGLGLAPGDIDKHVGWDIGAGELTQFLAERMKAPAVFQSYSRLVIDCNRPPKANDSAPTVSHGVQVPGNRDLSAIDHWIRVSEIFVPFQDAVDSILNHADRKLVLSIHSFEPELNGRLRPWDIGLLFRNDTITSSHFQAALKARRPDLNVGMNQPYDVDDESDLFVPYHGEARGIAHILLEVRNDHLQTTANCQIWAELLHDCINDILPMINRSSA